MDWLHELPPEMWTWGPGFILGLLVLIGVYLIVRQALRALGGVLSRLAETALSEFISAQKAQAEAMGRQATAMTGLAASVQTQSERGQLGHERVLLQLRVLREEMDDIRLPVHSLQVSIAAISAGLDAIGGRLESLPCRNAPGCGAHLNEVNQ